MTTEPITTEPQAVIPDGPPDPSFSRSNSYHVDLFGRVRGDEDDITASLRNVGARARRSVNEGYRNDYFPPIKPAPLLGPPRTFFRTASENRRDLFTKTARTGELSSAATNNRDHSLQQQQLGDLSVSDTASVTSEEQNAAGVDTLAPLPNIFGLARDRPLGKSLTSPAGSNLFTNASSIPAEDSVKADTTSTQEEEDWSEAAFGGPSSTAFKRL